MPERTIQYFVIAVETCRECNGAGMIQHPAWREYWKQFPPSPGDGNGRTVEQDVEWFRERGYRCFGDCLPNEELPCVDCDGTGKVRREVPLAEAVANLEIAEIMSRTRFGATSVGSVLGEL